MPRVNLSKKKTSQVVPVEPLSIKPFVKPPIKHKKPNTKKSGTKFSGDR